ncbi:hypothetical protein [Haloferax sp. YSSS75]|uniref:hypothetical protein n=1 Tax=Haloferax sp. YSSS75 TaxID=3388564 RepID=UPI00398C916F
MSRRRIPRSVTKSDETILEYEITTLSTSTSSKIIVAEKGDDDQFEVIAGSIPVPRGLTTDLNYPSVLDGDTLREHSTAKWILGQALKELSEYDWNKSYAKTSNPNYILSDIDFTCSADELDQAVMDAKRFISVLDCQCLEHSQKFEYKASRELPSEQI